MKRMRVLVGGPLSEWPDALHAGQLDGPWAAADRGALRLLAMNQVPLLTVGDFDSMTATERETTLAEVATGRECTT
jgi:Thiamine pyrophosphokinase